MPSVTNWLTFQSAFDAGPLGFGAEWTNPTGALGVGGSEATSGPIGFVAADGEQTTLLRITQPSLGGQIPPDFVLLGVEVEVRGRWQGGSDGARSVLVQSVVADAVRQSLGSCSLPISGSPGTCIKGGPTNTLGFSEADIALPGFGFQLQGTSSTFSGQGNTLFIDSARVRIHWDEPSATPPARGRSRHALTRGALA